MMLELKSGGTMPPQCLSRMRPRLESPGLFALARDDEKWNCECMDAELKTKADAMDGGMETGGRNGRENARPLQSKEQRLNHQQPFQCKARSPWAGRFHTERAYR
jgi:hypothetical protein